MTSDNKFGTAMKSDSETDKSLSTHLTDPIFNAASVEKSIKKTASKGKNRVSDEPRHALSSNAVRITPETSVIPSIALVVPSSSKTESIQISAQDQNLTFSGSDKEEEIMILPPLRSRSARNNANKRLLKALAPNKNQRSSKIEKKKRVRLPAIVDFEDSESSSSGVQLGRGSYGLFLNMLNDFNNFLFFKIGINVSNIFNFMIFKSRGLHELISLTRFFNFKLQADGSQCHISVSRKLLLISTILVIFIFFLCFLLALLRITGY